MPGLLCCVRCVNPLWGSRNPFCSCITLVPIFLDIVCERAGLLIIRGTKLPVPRLHLVVTTELWAGAADSGAQRSLYREKDLHRGQGCC